MTTTTTAAQILGITGDITECEHCGRRGLRKTVVLRLIDATGDASEPVHYGSECAARALDISGGAREVTRAAKAALVATLRAAREGYQRIAERHSRLVEVVDGKVRWTRPALLDNAAKGIPDAARRVDVEQVDAEPGDAGRAAFHRIRDIVHLHVEEDAVPPVFQPGDERRAGRVEQFHADLQPARNPFKRPDQRFRGRCIRAVQRHHDAARRFIPRECQTYRLPFGRVTAPGAPASAGTRS